MSTIADFVVMVTALFDVVKQGILLFTEPPIAYFVALGFLAAVVTVGARLVPRRKAK